MTLRLYTSGYEGQAIDSFLRRLTDVGVRMLVNVRELPLSRKRGFSKRALAAALAEHGIAYRHVPALGCPKPIRDQLRADGDWPRYVRDFGAHLALQSDAICELAAQARLTPCSLLCFESDFNRCHRSLVARAMANSGAPPVAHITAAAMISDAGYRTTAGSVTTDK